MKVISPLLLSIMMQIGLFSTIALEKASLSRKAVSTICRLAISSFNRLVQYNIVSNMLIITQINSAAQIRIIFLFSFSLANDVEK